MLVKEGDVCLTREDFWSLCLPRNMESNVGIGKRLTCRVFLKKKRKKRSYFCYSFFSDWKRMFQTCGGGRPKTCEALSFVDL